MTSDGTAEDISLPSWMDDVFHTGEDACCPHCGAPVADLVDGGYVCKSNNSHIIYRRSQLDGDIKWWHGRLGLFSMLFALSAYMLFIALPCWIWGQFKRAVERRVGG